MPQAEKRGESCSRGSHVLTGENNTATRGCEAKTAAELLESFAMIAVEEEEKDKEEKMKKKKKRIKTC